MLYATKFFVPDAFLLLVQDGRSTILLSDLEVDRGRRDGRRGRGRSASRSSPRSTKKRWAASRRSRGWPRIS